MCNDNYHWLLNILLATNDFHVIKLSVEINEGSYVSSRLKVDAIILSNNYELVITLL